MSTWTELIGRAQLRSLVDDEGHFWLEQNATKKTKWAKLARDGHDVAWEFSKWLVGTIWTEVNADCDGPVANAVHIYTGAQLRTLTMNGAFVSSEDNPGVDSQSGCGSNSDYVVQWRFSIG